MASDDVTDTDLSERTLTEIPKEVLQNCEDIRSLNLAGNNGIQLHSCLKLFRRLNKLVLIRCALSDIPDGIYELQEIEKLYLDWNDFSNGIRSGIRGLIHLKKLTLRGCELEGFPECIGELEQLEKLKLNGNDFSNGLSPAIGRLTRLKKLALRGCQLTCLPDSIGDLEQLEELDLCSNDFSNGICTAIGRLLRLKKLDLAICDLTDFPKFIGDLEQLEELNLYDNDFSNGLSPAIGRLIRLQKLDLRSCKLKYLPDGVGDLEQLEKLDLNENSLRNGLSPAIGRLSRLKMLSLWSCELEGLAECIGDLEKLEELEIYGNNFSNGLSPAAGRLICLKKLDLRSCSLKCLPDCIGDLQQLEYLHLHGNSFSNGLSPAIGRLIGLKKLFLRSCNLKCLPDCVGNLEQLIELDLSENELQDYPYCTLKLKRLQGLDLSTNIVSEPKLLFFDFNEGCDGNKKVIGNRITQLPVELAYTNLRKLSLFGNPITEPPKEIWEQGFDAIKSFMRAVLPGGTLMNADTLNMIGDTGAGKTSVARSLMRRAPHPTAAANRTRVLKQRRLMIDENSGLFVNINDFGGHDIYHSVMPIFLPSNGLIVLVVDLADQERRQEAVQKWLLTVIAKCREIRVIIAGTHADQVGDQRSDIEKGMHEFRNGILQNAIEEVNAHIDFVNCRPDGMHDKLKRLYLLRKALQSADIPVVTLSCTLTDEGLTKLFGHVVKSLRPPEMLPIRWCEIIKVIMTFENLFMTMKQVENVCKAKFTDADDDQAIYTILRYLSRTSHIIWLEDHEQLRDYIFHSPQKIINTCKDILFHDTVRLTKLRVYYQFEVDEYERGILHEPLLRKLLSTHTGSVCQSEEHVSSESSRASTFDVVVNFLQKFNVISCVGLGQGGRQFIVPYKVLSSAPLNLHEVEAIGHQCLNRITVRLSFIGSIIPMSLFETSLPSMLSTAGEWAEHYVWRDGLIIIRNGVYFIAKRHDPVITFSAFSKVSEPSPWTLLHPIFQHLSDDVNGWWHGAPPHCFIECPWCARHATSKNGDPKLGVVRTDLTRLTSIRGRDGERLTCKVCMRAIPRSLCFPTQEGGSFTSSHSDVDAFFSDFSRMRSDVLYNTDFLNRQKLPESELRKNLRLASVYVAENLTSGELEKILDELWSTVCITTRDKDNVQAEPRGIRRATLLLEILYKKNTEAIWTFERLLRNINRPDLADRLLSGESDRR